MMDNPHYEGSNSNILKEKLDMEDQTVSESAFTSEEIGYPLLASSTLTFIKEIGEGAFGQVYLAQFQQQETNGMSANPILVAVRLQFSFPFLFQHAIRADRELVWMLTVEAGMMIM